MAFGRLMHTIFELAARGEVAGDPESLKAAYRERFDPAWFPSRAVAHQYWRDGMAMLRLWHHGEAEAAREALRFEVGFEMEVAGHLVRGRIDRVDRRPDHAARVERRLVALLEGAAAEAFDPNPHADCRMCAFKPICPMWPQGEDFLAPTPPPQSLGEGTG